jgi:deoxyribodipyrimidine photolyase-related protein
MSAFRTQLKALQKNHGTHPRTWHWIPYDQLHDGFGGLARHAAKDIGIVLIESRAKGAVRPYHPQKLAFILANQRHFALEQAARGVVVDYIHTDEDYATALRQAARAHGALHCMRPAERELRANVAPLVEEKLLQETTHEGWLSTAADFAASHTREGHRMDAFYRALRQRTGWLMDNGAPVGGKYSFDAENRRSWDGDPPAPVPPTFAVDDISKEVIDVVHAHYAHHGEVSEPSLSRHPQTRAHAEQLWLHAKQQALPAFGPFEDAMASNQPLLFHSGISAAMNVHRLLPKNIVSDVLKLPIELSSKEGFVRQVVGWREFVRHVHEHTDGFRTLSPKRDALGQSCVSVLGASEPLPPAYWSGAPSGLNCLDRVVADVWRDAYSHHIPRLMVLSNIASLLDVEPRALTDWFWIAYVDAFDWVVEPNVMAMGTYGAGPVMTTKPYIAGSAYIDKMSDYCGGCAFHPKKNCPLTPMYWDYLQRHADALAGNHRMAVTLAAARKRTPTQKQHDARVYQITRRNLSAGKKLSPPDFA